MTLTVKIDNMTRGRVVPLQPILLYHIDDDDDKRTVRDQSILKVATPLIIDDTGEAILMCRIDEVSSRHQNKKFVIKLIPAWGNEDVIPGYSGEILVKAKKRPKRLRGDKYLGGMDAYNCVVRRGPG